MSARSPLAAAIIAIAAVSVLTSCASDGRPRRVSIRVEENIALDGVEEVPGIYSRGDGFWSWSYTIAEDGTFEHQFFPDDLGQIRDSDTVRGTWRFLGRQQVETEWKDPDGTLRHETLQFVAVDRKLGFVEESHRRALESEHGDWRSRIFIFVKHEPNKALEPTPGSVTSRANLRSSELNLRPDSPNPARAAPAPVVAHL